MMTIIIDAGHGGKDSGAVGDNNRLEKDDNLKVALSLGHLLKDYAKIGLTRSEDVFLSLEERSKFCNDHKGDLFISIHRNGFTDKNVKGYETLYKDARMPLYNLRENIRQKMSSFFTLREDKHRTNLSVLNNTKCDSLVLELGFITNMQDCVMFDTAYEAIVQAIADAIILSYDLKNTKKEELTASMGGCGCDC